MIVLEAILIFLNIIIYLIFFDVILSWLTLFGIRWRPQFIASIIDPLYAFVRKIIPTRIGAFDLTPIVILIAIYFISGVILTIYPELGIGM
ncbi:MAG: YggT family protein [Candidatus Gracilibacteria bacterium]|nr:YggT family protein [Candidatus Gracilibacteria bacterium]